MARQAIDTIQAKDQLQALQAMLKSWGAVAWMAAMFWILDKNGRIVPFRLNRIQSACEEDQARNNIFGKPRQSGFTTWCLLRRGFLPVLTDYGIGSLLISHNGEYAGENFRIVLRAYRLLGALDPYDSTQNMVSQAYRQNVWKVRLSNKKELVFEYLDSKIRIASAEVEEAGQGLTLHHVIADEYARWPGSPRATLANVRGALVPGGTVDKPSTANGLQGPYYEDVMESMDNAKAVERFHYFSWWWDDTYFLDLSKEQRVELVKDLTADELKVIAQMHKELSQAVPKKAAAA